MGTKWTFMRFFSKVSSDMVNHTTSGISVVHTQGTRVIICSINSLHRKATSWMVYNRNGGSNYSIFTVVTPDSIWKFCAINILEKPEKNCKRDIKLRTENMCSFTIKVSCNIHSLLFELYFLTTIILSGIRALHSRMSTKIRGFRGIEVYYE